MKMLSMRLSQRLRQNTLTWALCVLPLAFGSYACGSTSDPSSAADGATEGAADASPARQGELSGLSISSRAPLEPAFAPTQLIYNVDTSVLEEAVTVTPTAENASILVNGMPVESGAASPLIALDLGPNQIAVQVTGEDGDTRNYDVEVVRGALVIEQVVYGKASNPDIDDQFSVVALSGDTLAVGAPGEDSEATGVDGNQQSNAAENSGAVYVFRREGATWVQEAYLKASNAEAGDRFGFEVSLDGDTLAVAAISEDSSSTGIGGNEDNNDANTSGAVYVFRRSGETWSQEAYVKASNTDASDRFGTSISLSGDSLAVGAQLEASNASGINGSQNNLLASSGAVYVFRRNGTSWSQEAYIKASNPGLVDGFGESVSLHGDALAVGASAEDSNASGVNGVQDNADAQNSGAVYLFRRSGTSWSQEAYIKASNVEESDKFGESVALYADTLAVGATREDSSATGVGGSEGDNATSNSGAVYVFRKTGDTWAQEAYIKAANTDAVDVLGQRLALSNDLLVVAANEASNATGIGGNISDNSAEGSGAVYMYRREGTSWLHEAYIKSSNSEADDRFGVTVSLAGSRLVIGSLSEASNASGVNGDETNNALSNSGAIYLFE
tara:strand:- start:80421 stop:82268 length:1848 start_codon:yes stop_codon:yes gene_type:complete